MGYQIGVIIHDHDDVVGNYSNQFTEFMNSLESRFAFSAVEVRKKADAVCKQPPRQKGAAKMRLPCAPQSLLLRLKTRPSEALVADW